MKKTKNTEFNDLGLGTKNTISGQRFLNTDGSFNVRKTNVSLFEKINFFHSLITMGWVKFFSLIIAGYFVVNVLFASLYVFIGLEHLTGTSSTNQLDAFFEAFFFSSQTITTLGYGRVAPIGVLANSVAAVESLLGLLFFALATGMLYGRFAKPLTKIRYSSISIIGPYNNINAYMFRVINPLDNNLVEVEVNVSMSLKKKDSDLREFYQLDLERNKIVFFPYSWTIVHPINDSSPLQNLLQEDLAIRDVEFIIMLKAFDESFSQTVYSRYSYKAHDLLWGKKFVYIVNQENGGVSVNVGRIDETEMAELN